MSCESDPPGNYSRLHVSTKAKVFAALLSLFVTAAETGVAETNVLALMTSSTDGNGLFAYTLSRPDDAPPYVFELGDATVYFTLRSYGILDVAGPTGWISTVGSDGWITWYPTNEFLFLESTSFVFSVRSSLTTAVLYDQTSTYDVYPTGYIAGYILTYPDHQQIPCDPGTVCTGTVGFQSFPLLGPAVPEPSPFALHRVRFARTNTRSDAEAQGKNAPH